MKFAISGKGGTGKTTIAAGFGMALKKQNRPVILIDADPDANLQTTLGINADIKPLIELKDIIRERTGSGTNNPTGIFKLNPRVDDIPEKFFYTDGPLKLGIMGTIRGAGLGCVCPESAFLKSLLRYLILDNKETLILDMEAGIEHLGRGTASGIDCLIIVCEPYGKSIETSLRIKKLASGLPIKRTVIIGNKIDCKKDEEFIAKNLSGLNFAGFIPLYTELKDFEIEGISKLWYSSHPFLRDLENLLQNMEGDNG